MYTQEKQLKNGQLTDLADGDGETVRLLEQTGEHKAIFVNAAGDKSTLPSSDFFATHREATPAETKAYKAAVAAAKPDKAPA